MSMGLYLKVYLKTNVEQLRDLTSSGRQPFNLTEVFNEGAIGLLTNLEQEFVLLLILNVPWPIVIADEAPLSTDMVVD